MERKKLVVCYSGSGVKTLRIFASILVAYAILGLILIFVGSYINYENKYAYSPTIDGDIVKIFGISAIITGCILSPVLRGIATIAETALIKKHLIQTEYEIVESTGSATIKNTNPLGL